MINGRPVGRVVSIGFRVEEHPDGIELENNLFEPKFVSYGNRNVCNCAINKIKFTGAQWRDKKSIVYFLFKLIKGKKIYANLIIFKVVVEDLIINTLMSDNKEMLVVNFIAVFGAEESLSG